MSKTRVLLITPLVVLLFAGGCATFRSDIEGSSQLEAKKTVGAELVDVLFMSRHLVQTRGLDAIPKLQRRHQILQGYDDILLDASRELSNLNRYAAYTEFSSDMSDPKRIALKDSLMSSYEYRMVIEFRKEKSFSKYFLGTLGSVLSMTILPIPYTQEYYLNVDVYDKGSRLKKTYTRSARTTKWVEALLLPVYPFHTEKRKTEEIYVEVLHDVFRQIEIDQVLQADP